MKLHVWPDQTVEYDDSNKSGMSDCLTIDREKDRLDEAVALVKKHFGADTQLQYVVNDYYIGEAHEPDPMDVFVDKIVAAYRNRRYATKKEAEADKCKDTCFWSTLRKDEAGYWWELECLVF